ncbi:MAG: hypothetical protein HC858_05200 [Brachymonas sp.]|nr:hypothetical protein [Brachymonas sp.]
MSAERISESDLMALAAHLHVHLRRRTGRVIDVEWLVSNAEYAHVIIHLAKASAVTEGAPELAVWAARFEMAMMKVQRPRKPLMSALAIAGANHSPTSFVQSERQQLPASSSFGQDSRYSDSGFVSEFGESSRKVDTSELAPRKPLREAYVWSLR